MNEAVTKAERAKTSSYAINTLVVRRYQLFYARYSIGRGAESRQATQTTTTQSVAHHKQAVCGKICAALGISLTICVYFCSRKETTKKKGATI
ncbi:MAG: hypothetical protein IJ760_03650 [Bacteroidales bacterium]|nr:hypothetical protein [Bacteroidales bacterium]